MKLTLTNVLYNLALNIIKINIVNIIKNLIINLSEVLIDLESIISMIFLFITYKKMAATNIIIRSNIYITFFVIKL